MITLTQTRDVLTLDRIIKDDAVWPYVVDDSCPPPEQFTLAGLVAAAQNVFYLVTAGKQTCGFFAFLAGELHTCLLKNCRGRAAVDAGKAAIDKYERETGARVRSFAWREQPQTIWYARAIGLTPVEESEHSSTRAGKPVTRVEFIHELSPLCHS